jgi:hypothetical protein
VIVVDRRFQLDEIVAPTVWIDAQREALAEHQPQARLVSVEG